MVNMAKGGKTLNDRMLAADVRTLTLKKIKPILEATYDPKKEKDELRFQRELILKLASTVLPRINEHSGNNGDPIVVELVKYGNSNKDEDPSAASIPA